MDYDFQPDFYLIADTHFSEIDFLNTNHKNSNEIVIPNSLQSKYNYVEIAGNNAIVTIITVRRIVPFCKICFVHEPCVIIPRVTITITGGLICLNQNKEPIHLDNDVQNHRIRPDIMTSKIITR